MAGFRRTFVAQRLNRKYWKSLGKTLATPITFYKALAIKAIPGLHASPIDLILDDGKRLRLREFWSLFLFDEVFVQSCYEPDQIKKRTVRTIIDVGANLGFFTIRSKQLWPNAIVVAIEPDPNNYASLVEHIGLNKLSDIKPLQIGLSDKCGCFDLYLAPRNIAGHSMYKKTDRSIEITTKTLADIIAMLPNSRCDLLKIDCEGCEFSILSTLTQELADRIGCIIFEPEHGLYNLEALNHSLASLGFNITSFHGLVVAERQNLSDDVIG
jgi:FkbM family methyltransferase